MSDPLYALFVLDESITKEVRVNCIKLPPNPNSPTQYLEEALTRAYHGDNNSGFNFHVATTSYIDLPAPPEVHKGPPSSGTRPPLPASWSSPWIGKTVEDCAKWLQNMPKYNSTPEKQYLVDTAVNTNYFVMMNEFSVEEDIVFVCRVVKEGGEGGKGELRIEYFPQDTDKVQMMMWTNWQFDERATNYVRARWSDGKPDRSRYEERWN